MPNRGELASPTMRAATAVSAGLDADAWMVIGFCTIGWLAWLCMAVSSIDADAMPGLLMQIPWG